VRVRLAGEMTDGGFGSRTSWPLSRNPCTYLLAVIVVVAQESTDDINEFAKPAQEGPRKTGKGDRARACTLRRPGKHCKPYCGCFECVLR